MIMAILSALAKAGEAGGKAAGRFGRTTLGMDKPGGGTDVLGPFRRPAPGSPFVSPEADKALQPAGNPYQPYQPPDATAGMMPQVGTPMSPAMETEQQRRRRAMGPFGQ